MRKESFKAHCALLAFVLTGVSVSARENSQLQESKTVSSRNLLFETDRRRREISDVFDTEYPQETVETFCPSTTQCPTETFPDGFEKEEQIAPCCFHCDCTETCAARGTCCRDFISFDDDAESTTEDLIETCVETDVGDENIESKIRDTGYYWLIKSCQGQKSQNGGHDVIDKCLRPDENIFDEMMPVYSHVTKRNYRNRYCAMCNNDTVNIYDWESHYICLWMDRQSSLFPNEVGLENNVTVLESIRLSKGCVLKWRPSFGRVRKCIDQHHIISSCLNSQFTDRKLEILCPEIYSPVKGERGLYKNVFCLACNEGNFLTKNSCFIVNRVMGSIFSTILATNAYVMTPVRKRDTRCPDGLTYDYTLNSCIQKTCPISQMSVGDTCIPVMEKVKDISFDYRIKVVYAWNKFKLNDHENVFSQVRHLVLHDNISHICEEKILKVQTEGEYMVVRIQMTKQLSKHVQYDIKNDFEMFDRKIQIMKNRVTIDNQGYTVRKDNSAFKPITKGYVTYGIYNDFTLSYKCLISIAMSGMQFCTTVLVKNFTERNGGIIIISNKTFLPGEYISAVGRDGKDKGSVYICRRLYVTRIGVGITRVLSVNSDMKFTPNMLTTFVVVASGVFTLSHIVPFA